MARPVKTQWDFGELFPTEQTRKVLSVTELTWQIRRLLEKDVGQIWVTGEITNFKSQSSGHIYFTLKDAAAQLSCVLFRGETQADRALVQDGRKVILRGDITVYEARGQYQLRVTAVEPQGVGALQAAFEQLKLKLQAQGLFAQERKRSLPRFPQRIGLVTSATGAAFRDVLHVIERRNPSLEIILAPCRVQGEGAAAEIAVAVRLLNELSVAGNRHVEQTAGLPASGTAGLASMATGEAQGAGGSYQQTGGLPHSLDLILLTRGGGSLEDLWAFNEEVVARAIFESSLPVVSAVGHEIDFTISDFVADVRAATPSVAAELITEGVFASAQFFGEAAGRIRQLTWQQLDDKHDVLAQTGQRLARMHPRRRLDEWLQRLDDAQASLVRCSKQGARQQQVILRNVMARLWRVRPVLLLKQRREVFEQAEQRLREQTRHRLREAQNRLASLAGRLRLLGPEQVLARGYSITMDADTGEVLREAEKVRAGQALKTRLKRGEVRSKVESSGSAMG
jgi:exodeoxyribonuclease VII large subunit